MNLKSLITTFTLIFIGLSLKAQPPAGYYNSAENLTGEQLKSALHEIIKGHTEFPYTSSSTDVWDILKESDRDTANPDNVILFYTGWSVNAAQEYNSGNGWTREHVWAKSHGEFDTDLGAGTDAHHIRPADNSVNSARNNKDFDTGGTLYIDGDGPTECYTDSDSWEPRDAVKGDVARMLFYMAVRYEGENGEPDLELVDGVNTVDLNEPGKGYHGNLERLIYWNDLDPVDNFEINRNNVVYSFQGNRNPFIDHPEYVDLIWVLTGTNSITQSEQIKVYPNPAIKYFNIEASFEIEKVEVYTNNGVHIDTFSPVGNQRLSISTLNPGMYVLAISSKNTLVFKKVLVR